MQNTPYHCLHHPTERLKEILTASPITSFKALTHALMQVHGIDQSKGEIPFPALKEAIQRFNDFVRSKSADPTWDYCSAVLPKIVEWSCEGELNKEITPLGKTQEIQMSFSEQEIRFILANTFFDNIQPLQTQREFGNLSFMSLYVNRQAVSVNRILCWLCYFYLAHHANSEQTISFERYNLQHEDVPAWADDTTLVNMNNIHIHKGSMEDVDASAFVNFANASLHIHKVIPSATQEEILFSCCPEAFPGILFCETLDDNEIMIIKGCRRFCSYTGYLNGFKFEDYFDPPKPAQDMVVIDAVYWSHFATGNVIRDLCKAYLGFKKIQKGQKISTGNWGCGAFGGNPIHKFIQQICAASLVGVKLEYSTFNDEDLANQLSEILSLIHQKKATVADMFGVMVAMQKQQKRPLLNVVKDQLNEKKD